MPSMREYGQRLGCHDRETAEAKGASLSVAESDGRSLRDGAAASDGPVPSGGRHKSTVDHDLPYEASWSAGAASGGRASVETACGRLGPAPATIPRSPLSRKG